MPEQPTALPQPPVQQPPLVNAPSGPVAPLTQADLPEQDLVDAGPPAPPEPGRLIAVKPQPRPTEVRGPGIPPLDPRTAPKLTSGDPADHFDSVFQGAELAKFENLMDLIGEQLPRSEIERWVAYVPPETDYSLTGLIGTFSLKDKPPEGLIRPGDAPASAIWGPKYKSETDEEALARLKRIAQAKAYYTRQALYTRMGSAFLTFGLADATPPLERLYGKAEQLNPDLGKSLIGLQTEHPLVGKLAPSDISTLTGFFIPGSPSGKLFHRLMREFQVAATPAARSARQAFRARFGEKVLDADPKMFKSLDRMVEQANGVVSTKGYIHLPKGIDPALKDAIMQEAKRLSNVARDLTGIRRRAFRVISTEGGPIGPAQRLAGHTGAMTSFSGLHTGVAAATHPDQAGEILRTLPESMAHGAATGAGLFFPLGELAGLATRGRQGMGYDVVPRWENPRRPLGGAVDSEGRYLSVEGNVVDKNGRITTLDPQKFAHELRPVDPAPTFGEALQRVDQSAVDQISDLNHADPARRLLARAQHEQGTGEISVGSLVARDPAGLTLDDPTEVPIVQRNGRLYGLKDVDGQLQAIDITDSLAPLNIPAEARYTFAEDPTSPIRYTLKEEPGKPEELVVDASATAGRDVHRLMLRLLQDPAAEVDVDPMTIWATVNQAPPATEARCSGYAKQVKKVEAQLEEAFANSREVAKQLAGSDATDWQVEDVHTKLISRLQLQRLALREAARALNMPLRIPSAPAVQAAP
ncbi:MAG TPA: hypothetical protein ENK56_06595, partial [Chloroflexi bacterium]|nr:hypothetical protein [Chloroflexota bacterium]